MNVESSIGDSIKSLTNLISVSSSKDQKKDLVLLKKKMQEIKKQMRSERVKKEKVDKALRKELRKREKEDLLRRKESQRNLRRLLRTRGYWNKESNKRAKEQFENENDFEEIYHGSNNYKIFRIKNLYSKTIEKFLDKIKSKATNKLEVDTKVIYILKITLTKGVDVEGKKRQEIKSRDHYIVTKPPHIILTEDDKYSSYNSLNEYFNKEIVGLKTTESGWKLKSIDWLDIKMVKYHPLKGGCKTHKLPEELEKKKCLIQLESENNRCFMDSIDYLEKIENYEKLKNKKRIVERETSLNWDKISFPASKKDIEIFEKNNPNNLVYVFEYSNEEFTIFYKNKNFHILRPNSKVFELLFYNNHYYPIVNPKAFHKIVLESEKNYHICLSCLQGFSSDEKLEDHYIYCQHEFSTKVKYPDPGEYISFKNHSSTLFHPFVCYLDIESCLEPIDEIKGETKLYQKHIASTFGLLFIDTIKQTSEYKKFKSAEEFIDQIIIYQEYISSLQLCMNNEELKKAKLDKPKECGYCHREFSEKDPSVKDHSHFSGKYRETIHQSCNLKRKDSYFLPIFAHNMMRYDEKLFIRAIGNLKNKSIIAKNLENFISFQFRHESSGKQVTAKFIDSYKFLSSSLSKLTEILDVNDLIQSRKFFQNEEIIRRKGVFPYDFVTSEKILDETTFIPPKYEFYSRLSQSHISTEDYNFVKYSWKELNCENLRDYMEAYLKLDVCLLADIFEKFRKTIYTIYNLDPVYYITIPSLAQECALKISGVKLECISDPTIYNFVESGIRGGYSSIHKRYAKANNKDMEDYDPSLPSSYIIYLDANNLYGLAMCLPLPIGNFHWIPVEDFDIDEDCIVDVDISIPKHLYNKLKDFPLCPRKENGKLLATLYSKKNYVCHSRYLKEILSHGYQLDKVNKVLGFNSEPWLKSYIEKNTELRTLAKTEFERSLWKIMNNSVFGKQIENLRNRIDVVMSNDKDLVRLAKKQNFENIMTLKENQYLVQMCKTSVTLNKPIYGGLAILDFSKIIMSQFYYNYIQPKFGDRYELLMTDTDSFLGLVYSKDFYQEIETDIKDWFDTSNLDFFADVNKKVPGKFKDEMGGIIITEFVGLRAKQYTYKIEEGEVKRCKGINNQGMKDITFEDYKDILDGKTLTTKMNVIRGRNHNLFSETITKKIDGFDEKRKILENGIDTVPWGYG